jgi:hypothetical protein
MTNDSYSELAISYQRVAALKVNSKNARTHTPHQIRQIADSIRTFGFTNPVLIDRNNRVIAGHGRVAAAKLLGVDPVPTIRLEGLSGDQIRSYIIADNKLAENADWDRTILGIELQHLLTIDGDFDVTITGFEIPDVDLVIEEASGKKQDKADLFRIDETNQIVTQSGAVWRLGRHRILCGNALHDASFRTLMDGRQADFVFADPPYNIAIDGNVPFRTVQPDSGPDPTYLH